MKVRELVQDLLLADQDADVYVASHAWGNIVKPYDDWSAEVVDEDGELYFDDASDNNAIVIWPV